MSATTALVGLRAARLEAGQTVLITGAGGGVGSYAVQLARTMGAEVTGVCSTSKLDLVRSLGAHHVVDYTREDFTAGDRTYDVIIDLAGRRAVSALRRALAPSGTLVLLGGEGGGRWLGLGRQIWPVRGIYFIPFLGGAAVHSAPIPDRWHQVYVDLNGPLWGGALALAALATYYATGRDEPFWAALASWWALINLFNLLPVLPLDGGRALSAIAFSLDSSLSGVLVFAGLLLGAGLAIATHLDLLALMAVIGALEFGGELAAARWRVALRALARPARVDFATWRRLQGLTRTVSPGDDTPRALAADRALYDRRRAIALGTPMTGRQLAIAIAGYAALVAVLIATMRLVAHEPGADISALLLGG